MRNLLSVKDLSLRFINEATERNAINGILGADVCGPLFGGMNLYALADGLPVWCNLMLAIMDECDSAFSREQMRTNPRIKKYTAKYHR